MAASPIRRVRPPRRWCVGLLAVWIITGFAFAERSPLAETTGDNSRLDCSFLAMGHGCAIVLELPSGQTILYDAGQFGAPAMATRSIAGALWSQGITHLDAVVLSHGDVDHYNALPGLLERFSVGVVYVSPVMFLNPNPALEALEEAIEGSGVEIRELVAGDLIDGGDGCRIEVLHACV